MVDRPVVQKARRIIVDAARSARGITRTGC
jgi:hypothetical protein